MCVIPMEVMIDVTQVYEWQPIQHEHIHVIHHYTLIMLMALDISRRDTIRDEVQIPIEYRYNIQTNE
jgi:hypothetical protein